MEIILGLLIGIGLSIAAGFRVFVPLLVTSIASISGYFTLSDSFLWIGTYPALITFLVATIVEIAAFYIPFIDNLLDTVAPFFVSIAGIILTASSIGETTPLVSWGLAIIAGVPAGLSSQLLSSGSRATSTATTGGAGNFIVATLENIKSVVVSILAIFAPILIPFILLFVLFLIVIVFKKLKSLKINPFFTRKKIADI